MDEPYIKLLLLIIPAIFVVAQIVLFPLLEEKKIKNNFLKKTLTIVVDIYDHKDQLVEQFITDGKIESIIDDELIEINRKTQPIFRIPYLPNKMSKQMDPKFNTDYYIQLEVVETIKFDKIKGFTAFQNS